MSPGTRPSIAETLLAALVGRLHVRPRKPHGREG